MNTLDEKEALPGDHSASPYVKMSMLQQMAEALDDEAAALNRRAAAFEEEASAISRELQERQAALNRLTLKVEAMCSEHDSLMKKVASIKQEAAAMREEACNIEDDIALAQVEGVELKEEDGDWRGISFTPASGDESRSAVYFQRMVLTDYSG